MRCELDSDRILLITKRHDRYRVWDFPEQAEAVSPGRSPSRADLEPYCNVTIENPGTGYTSNPTTLTDLTGCGSLTVTAVAGYSCGP